MARWQQSHRVTFRHRAELAGIRLVAGAFRRLPPDRAIALGARLGAAAWRLGVRRRVALDNVRRAVGVEGDPEDILRRAYANLGRTFAEYALLPTWTPEACAARLTFEGLEHVESALRAGQGVVALSGHFGSLELMAASFRILGVRPTVVVAPMRNRLASRYVKRERERGGLDVIEVGPGLREAFRVLKRGGLLCLAADQDAGRHGVPVRFLGRWASAATGPFELALRTGAPVVWGLIHREGATRHRVRIDAPEVLTAHGDHGETLRYHAQAYADRLANGVRLQPDQWFWLHRRWKTAVSAPSAPPDTAATPH